MRNFVIMQMNMYAGCSLQSCAVLLFQTNRFFVSQLLLSKWACNDAVFLCFNEEIFFDIFSLLNCAFLICCIFSRIWIIQLLEMIQVCFPSSATFQDLKTSNSFKRKSVKLDQDENSFEFAMAVGMFGYLIDFRTLYLNFLTVM